MRKAASANCDIDRRDQFDVVPKLCEIATPLMAAGASLHRDRAGFDGWKELQQLATRDLPVKNRRAICLACMDLDGSLRQIPADNANLFHGRFPLSRLQRNHSGTSDAVDWGRPPHRLRK